MNKKNQILIIGSGSIGKRHLRNLINLGYRDICLIRRQKKKLIDFPFLEVYTSIKEACNKNTFNFAIIATPSSMHYQNFIEISNENIPNVYIEKPIATNINEAIKIEKISKLKDINVCVGFDLHFDLGLIKVKELLKNNVIGNICSFQVEVGQFLPDWRVNEDYRKGMSAKKKLGGGVMLDLIHEFDYVNWIFGPIIKVFGKNNQISNLEIETEDVSFNIVQTKSGIFGSIYLDYLQKELSRQCKIVGNNGTIIWNYKDSTVKWMTHQDVIWKEFEYKEISRNDRFIEIIKAFIESNSEIKDNRLSNIEDAIQSLKMIEISKQSNIENKFMSI